MNGKEQECLAYPVEAGTEYVKYRLLQCKHCKIVFNRDVVGALNIAMVGIVASILHDHDEMVHLFAPQVEALLGLRPRKLGRGQKRGRAQTSSAQVLDDDSDDDNEGPYGQPEHAAHGSSGASAGALPGEQGVIVTPKAAGGKKGKKRRSDTLEPSPRPGSKAVRIKGDGNCGYRAIAQLLGGDQDEYGVVQAAAVKVGQALHPTLEMVKTGATSTEMLAETMSAGTSAAIPVAEFHDADDLFAKMSQDRDWFEDWYGGLVATALQSNMYFISRQIDPDGVQVFDELTVTEFRPFLLHELELDDSEQASAQERRRVIEDVVEQLRVRFPLDQRQPLVAYNLGQTHFEVACPAEFSAVLDRHPALSDELALVNVFDRTHGQEGGRMRTRVFCARSQPNWSRDALGGATVETGPYGEPV
ncbi:hypothetical protein JCM3770_002116 [Rhodotorula araucariae]